MRAELSAVYCGEPNTAAFLKRVGKWTAATYAADRSVIGKSDGA